MCVCVCVCVCVYFKCMYACDIYIYIYICIKNSQFDFVCNNNTILDYLLILELTIA